MSLLFRHILFALKLIEVDVYCFLHSFLCVLIFYYHVTNYHRLNDLK